MKSLTIIPSDSTIYIDGVARSVDCSKLPSYISAVQWNEEVQAGWIEFVQDGRGQHLPNQKIVERTAFNYLIQAWHAGEHPELPMPGSRANAS